MCYIEEMRREITQRELRNESGAVMRALDAGHSFTVTRNGVPVGELAPARRAVFVDKAVALSALARAPAIDPQRFRRDLDALADQDPTPRA
jgi:antitoxin (DNA-binding transcriptional repressor) of toxin-antitoxin stability system